MRRGLPVFVLLLGWSGAAQSHGILIPPDRTLPPLAMVNHQVTIAIDDQVATTHVEQTFRNHTERQLEATYVFPVPKGASVQKFSMWINGKEVSGELVPADKARQIYTEIVRRTHELADFIAAATSQHAIDASRLIASSLRRHFARRALGRSG